MSTYIDLEIIQTLPFSNANRDDAGQPKTVRVGGTTRGRLSSQSLKRAARFYGADRSAGYGIDGDTSGGDFYRTRYLAQLIEKAVEAKGGTSEQMKKVEKIFTTGSALGKLKKEKKDNATIIRNDVLTVVTEEEIDKLADAVIADNISKETIAEILVNSGKEELALWGRFFASSDAATLDGSAQIAHAFTTHAVTIEDDFFVGLDDAAPLFSTDAGAGHPGDSLYLTGTFYKYGNFNLEETILNLLNARMEKAKLTTADMSEEDVITAVTRITRKFLTSFILSVPQGKIRSTAHQTLPQYVKVAVRNNRPVSGASAFDSAVTAKDVTKTSIERLSTEHEMLKRLVGAPEQEYTLTTLADVASNTDSLDELINKVVEALIPKVKTAVALYSQEK